MAPDLLASLPRATHGSKRTPLPFDRSPYAPNARNAPLSAYMRGDLQGRERDRDWRIGLPTGNLLRTQSVLVDLLWHAQRVLSPRLVRFALHAVRGRLEVMRHQPGQSVPYDSEDSADGGNEDFPEGELHGNMPGMPPMPPPRHTGALRPPPAHPVPGRGSGGAGRNPARKI